MILYLVLSYFFSGSMAMNDTIIKNCTQGTNSTIDANCQNTIAKTAGASNFSTSIMCMLKGNLRASNSENVELDLKNIPKECEVIIYSRFSVNVLSAIDVDEDHLKLVVALNKPVILVLQREEKYSEWAKILDKGGNPTETKVLCDFAKKHNVAGFLIDHTTPQDMYEPFDENVGKYIIPYIEKLKCSSDFKIGVIVQPYGSAIQNPCMYDFSKLNNLVDFYDIGTSFMNKCNPKLYNGMCSTSKAIHSANYMLGMEEVADFLKKSKISLTKISYDIELSPVDMSSEFDFNTYTQVCKGELDISASCIQTTKNLYDKGLFAFGQNSGVVVIYLDLDDHKNDCGCGSFIGLKNIVAGLRGGPQTPCSKFDVQSTVYKFK